MTKDRSQGEQKPSGFDPCRPFPHRYHWYLSLQTVVNVCSHTKSFSKQDNVNPYIPQSSTLFTLTPPTSRSGSQLKLLKFLQWGQAAASRFSQVPD